MEPKDRSKWLPRLAAATLAILVALIVAGTWRYSNILRAELVTVDVSERISDIEIVTVGSGRIVVGRTDVTASQGIWGVAGANGYGQASVLIAETNETVERAFRTLDGFFDVGELVAFDPIAYPGDPQQAHGIEFEEVRFTGDLGVYPAWVVDGGRDTWVIVVHGSGPDQRAEALRILPALVAARYPVMVMTVRGDEGAPPSRNGLRALGASEWRDLAAAVDYGFAQNADEFILLGFDTGASVIATYLHEADDITAIRGVVYDSALHDPERVADRIATARNVPAPLRGAGKLLATIRFDIDWNELDQIDRAWEYTLPVLVLHGAEDDIAELGDAAEFAAAVGARATLVEFATGRHSQLWNADPARYEEALITFFERVSRAS